MDKDWRDPSNGELTLIIVGVIVLLTGLTWWQGTDYEEFPWVFWVGPLLMFICWRLYRRRLGDDD